MFGKHQRKNIHEPWKLTVHFVNPSTMNEVNPLELTGAKICERLYFHSLKQALQLLHGAIRHYNELSLEKQAELWAAPVFRRWEEFSVIREALIPSLSSAKHLPIRIIDARISEEDDKTQPKALRQRVVSISSDTTADDKNIITLRQILVDQLRILTPEELQRVNIVIQGIICDADVDAYEIWKYFCHADLFMYLIIESSST